MKITDIKTYALQAKLPEFFGASQTWGNTRSVVLVEVHTDEGIVGYGEAGAGRQQQANRAIVEGELKPMLISENPLGIEAIWQKVNRSLLSGLNRGMRRPPRPTRRRP